MSGERVVSMSPSVRRADAHYLRFVALPLLVIIGGAGCSHPSLPVAPHRYVRLDALLPLHPSWSQIQSMDRELARLKTAPQQAGPLRYEPHAAVPIFVPRATTPANMAKERAAQIDLDAKRYLESLRGSLASVNRSVLAVERRREQRRVDAAVAVRLADEAKRLQGIIDVKLFAIRERLKSLVLRDIVVKSQIQDLAQAHAVDITPLRTAQAEHADILKEVARLRAEDAALRAQDVAIETQRKRDTFYREETARSRERIAKRETELKAEMEDKLNLAMRQQRDTAIPPPAVPVLPPVDPRTTPLPLPVNAGPALVSASARVQPVLNRQAAIWEAQRTTIIDEIRADTRKAVQQVALERGWKLDPGPSPGALDGTKEAADALRAQWQIRSAP